MILLSLRGGGTSNPLNTRVWGSHNLEVKKFSSLAHYLSTKSFAFTMAEILISLTIIGVISAIIIPSLHSNIVQKAWSAKKKALYSRMSQAIDMMPKIAGYGEYTVTVDENNSSTVIDTAAMAFVTEGLQQVLKITNVCDNDNLDKCGLPSTIKTITGTGGISFPTKLSEMNGYFTGTGWVGCPNPQRNVDTKAVAFETVNGESVAVFYNPFCVAYKGQYDFINSSSARVAYTQRFMCANFIYDLNGKKGPNQFGKDLGFITAFEPEKAVLVSPTVYVSNATTSTVARDAAIEACKSYDNGNARLPNINELNAMVYNGKFLNLSESGVYWPINVNYSSNTGYAIDSTFYLSANVNLGKASNKVRCVKK